MTASTPVEIFCSYAREDESWLRKLETHLSLLKRQGLISFWHDRLITVGTDWAHAIDQYLETSSVILLLVSADFFASDYCVGIEMKRALERQKAGEALVIPILVRQVDWKDAPFAHLHVLPTDAKPLTSWQDEDTALADVTTGIRRAIENMSQLSADAPRVALPAIWNIPYPRNPFFMGREDLLLHLRAQLQTGQPMAISQHPQAISGLGGIGKTQTAVEYAYRFGREYQAVLWAQAENRETLVSSYVTFATLLNLPEQDTQEQATILQSVKRWLQTHRKWLLVLDNADELTLVSEFLPPVLGGHLLLTTRAQAVGRLASRIEVETFSAEQGALFLLRRAGLLALDASLEQAASDDREQSLEITKALGGLPLALDQTGAYLEEAGCSLSEYQNLYQQHRAILLNERRGLVDDHPPVATTWSLSFQKVEEKNPAAADLLRLCAFLQPDAIPEEIILEGGEPLGPHLQTLAINPLAFQNAIRTLRSYSLLQRSAEEHMLSMHRLVQAVLQDAMDEHERARWRERVLQVLSALFPGVGHVTWRRCERLLPHVLLYAAETKEQAESRELATVLKSAAIFLRESGQYEQAEPLFQRALRIWEQALGPEDLVIAFLLSDLADLYNRQGEYEQAELLAQRTLHILEQAGKSEHFQVVRPLTHLARTYELQGKYEQAEMLNQRALRILEQVGKSEHPRAVFPLRQLAHIYELQGKYEQAEAFYQQALQVEQQKLEPEPARVRSLLRALAQLYWRQGRYAEAEPLYQPLLHASEQQLAVHPNEVESYLDRGYTYLRLKKRDSACTDFAKYASLRPGNVNAAWMVVYASLGKQHPGVGIAERLEEIVELDPQCHEAYVCRGVALGLRGKPQEGLAELERALLLNAQSEDAWFWKGMMCMYLGQSIDALESIEQALRAGLPPILLTPIFWLEQERPQFYQEYAEPLLKQYGLL